jgi:tetratricopeptide (TPR) repeat protein
MDFGTAAPMPTTLPDALAYHQRGELDQAARLYRDILTVQPNHPDALHLLGVVALQHGQPRQAVEWIERAITILPCVADFYSNLAEAYRHCGQLPKAVECCQLALHLRPQSPQAANNLGSILLDQDKVTEAIPFLRRAISLLPDYAMAHNNLGNALRMQGDIPGAIARWRRAVELDDSLAMAHSNLGQLLLEQGQPDEALKHCRAAVRLEPHDFQALNNLGNVLRDLGQRDEARACYRDALRLEPNQAVIHHNLGQMLLEDGQVDQAIACLRQACELEPISARFHSNLGTAFTENEDFDKAAESFAEALRLDARYAEAHCGLGWLVHQQGRVEQAIAHYRDAIRVQPNHACAHCNLGQALEEMNDLAGAEASYREAVRHDPRLYGAWGALATLLRDRLPADDLSAVQRLLAEEGIPDSGRTSLLYAMAHVCDRQGDYEQAGAHLVQAKSLAQARRKQCGQAYEPQAHTRFVDRLIGIYTPAFLERVRGWGSTSERPIFIFGLPRSGTTLLEQILASHTQVFGAGELRLARKDFEALAPGRSDAECFGALELLDHAGTLRLAEGHLERLAALNAAAPRMTDKMPDNYLYLGLLALLFPRAKFIHCRRDLRDVAVSCWITYFRQVPWTNEIDHIATRFREYRRLMEHWRQVLPLAMLEVDYEETVADMEEVARRLVNWCGLAWEPTCLQFHQTQRPVRTASATQVRKPVYQNSVARWKHYDSLLRPLFDQLEMLGPRQCMQRGGRR